MPRNRRKRESCGPCTACCTALPVEGVPTPDGGVYSKPAGEPCVHLTATGCGIYATRPKACRDYQCLWSLGVRSVFNRPNVDGVLMSGVFDPTTETLRSVQAIEVSPGAAEPTLIRGFGILVRQEIPVVYHALNGSIRILAPDDILRQIAAATGEIQ